MKFSNYTQSPPTSIRDKMLFDLVKSDNKYVKVLNPKNSIEVSYDNKIYKNDKFKNICMNIFNIFIN